MKLKNSPEALSMACFVGLIGTTLFPKLITPPAGAQQQRWNMAQRANVER